MNALPKILLVESKLLLREKWPLLFVFALPLGLLLGFGAQPGSDKPNADLGGQSGAGYIAAIGAGVALTALGLQMLPSVLAAYRERGILRRLGVTPVPPAALLVAQVILNLISAVIVIAVLIVVGNLAFGTPVPQRFPEFFAAAILTMASLFAIGLFVAAVAPSGRGAQGIGLTLFFPSLFFGGVYIPREVMPSVLRQIGDYTPLGAGLKAMRDAWLGLEPRPLHLAIMAAYAVVAGTAAARFFRWE
ncbi:MAG TPA: ABC transporter permease [Streptosporangiaceae bacterium]|nr:ABC transporter permease [Streptosporangiaceae bacterium]